MRKKRERFGIKFPEGDVEEIAFGSSSSSGAVFGVTHSNRHITLIEERNAFSSHVTKQDTKKYDHLGRVSKNELTDKLWLDILKPRKLKESELDQTMMYLTKKFGSLFDIPDEVCFKVTEDKSMSYLDLDAISQHMVLFFQDLQKSPDAYLGMCLVRKMLSGDDIECGLLENGEFLLRIDKDIYKMDLSSLREALSMQNSSISQNPLLNVLKVLGVTSFGENLAERAKELLSKTQREDK